MYPSHPRCRESAFTLERVHMLDLLPSQIFELDVPECGQEMYLCDALVGLV